MLMHQDIELLLMALVNGTTTGTSVFYNAGKVGIGTPSKNANLDV